MRAPAFALALVLSTACTAEPEALDGASEGEGKEDDLSGTARGSELPDPNAAEAPPESWKPPAVSSWPDAYVIFNNTGCGHDCTSADMEKLKSRSVMIKMLNAAI